MDEEWLKPNTLKEIAHDLSLIADIEALALCYPADALKLASRLLPPRIKHKIKQWVLELNQVDHFHDTEVS